MSKPKAPADMVRVRRRLGDVIRATIACPWCALGPLEVGEEYAKVVAYRSRGVRCECGVCGLRFTLDIDSLLKRQDDWTPVTDDGTQVSRFMAATTWNRHKA